MNTAAKVILGIFTFLPVLLLILFFYNFFEIILHYAPDFNSGHIERPTREEMLTMITPLFLYIILTSLISLGLLIYYIVHAVNNKNIDSSERVIWVLLFVFIGLIAFPIYFFARINKQQPPAAVV
jgi:hypothetical protein